MESSYFRCSNVPTFFTKSSYLRSGMFLPSSSILPTSVGRCASRAHLSCREPTRRSLSPRSHDAASVR
eukprot:212029-Pleurochrysis_carterae.AAC.1